MDLTWEHHHGCFPRSAWNAFEVTRRIRAVPELIWMLRPLIHRELHSKIEQIPLPDPQMMTRIKREFYPERDDTIGTIRNFQEAVGIAMDNPYVSDIAFSLGGLIIASMEAQIPYIERSQNGGEV